MITTEQREARKRYIGSSDAAAVLGLDPYRSASDVWLEKTGRVDDFEGNENTERGNLLEPVVLAWAKKKIGEFTSDVMMIAPCRLLAANFDGLQPIFGGVQEGFVVEAKTSNNAGEWGDEGTDQVPDRVIAQAHHQMFVAGPSMRLTYVPVLMPGFRSFDFKMYRVERNDILGNELADRCRDFMRKYVQTDTRPDDFRPGLEILKRMRRVPNKSVELPDVLVDNFILARAAKKQAEEECEAAQAALLAELGDAEHGSYSKGYVTYLQTTRKAYEVKETTFRTLRLKAGKD